MSDKDKMEANGFRITDWNAAMCYLASERKAAMDAGYAQGIENAESRAVKRIDGLTAELSREREKVAEWKKRADDQADEVARWNQKYHNRENEHHRTVKAMGEAQTKAAHTLELILEGIADRNDDWVIGEIRAALASIAPSAEDEERKNCGPCLSGRNCQRHPPQGGSK